MSFTKETAVERAKNDLAKRLKIGIGEVKESGVSDKDFPDMSLGAAIKGEMSAQMISSGWQIKLDAKGNQLWKKTYNQLRRGKKRLFSLSFIFFNIHFSIFNYWIFPVDLRSL